MARKTISAANRLRALIERFEPSMRDAFNASIADIRSKAELNRLADSIERGDVEAAMRALHIDSSAFREVDEAIRRTFIGGGSQATDALNSLRDPTGGRLVIRFDARLPRAEAWLSDHSSGSITRLVEDQRLAVRQALTEGLTLGNNPRTTALDIVGRINPVSGRREGGIIGITSAQERYVATARRELLSGDTSLLRNYLDRNRRDKKFDGLVRKAIEEERKIDRKTVEKMVDRYSDRLLQLRGETVARTETMAALNASQEEAMKQAIDTGAVAKENVVKVWKPSPRMKGSRDNHQAMRGETVGINETFSNGLKFPGDPSGPIGETANCRCTMITKIDYTAGLT